MSQFKVKTQGLRNVVNEEENIEKQIFDIYSEVIQQKNSISFKVAATGNVRWRLENISSQIHSEGKTLQKMKKKLADVADKYERTEDTICKVSEDNKVTNWEKIINYNWLDGVPKTIAEILMDILTGFGGVGGGLEWLTALLKIALDGDGFSWGDIGSLIEGSGKSIVSVIDAVKDWKDGAIDKLWGLDKVDTIRIDSQAAWYQNAGKTFKETFLDDLNPTESHKIDGGKVAGWALALVANGFSNYEEHGDMTNGRFWAETVSETVIDIAKGAALTAAIAAGAAAIGVSAPAVVVAGAGVVVSSVADYVTKKLTGALMGEEKSLTEFVSDGILDLGTKAVDGIIDWGKKAMDGITGAWSSAKDTMCSWGRQLGFA